ncbi:hypothetical protein ATG_08430 [Desulfurococcaceae archaeon AG1]|jgi:hypothetical protein|nr:MAG: hypothetical protein DJ555_01435 [Desulfurococcaceae archaeon]GAY25640.1 hypothetical protein ATG_08430 [Desulfurococcaceae archaeon AG1]
MGSGHRGSGCREQGARIMIAKGEKALRIVNEMDCRSDVLFIVGPLSKIFLLYENMLKEVYDKCGYSLVIPSSYDDVAIYVNMRRLGYNICRRSAIHGCIEIYCLERGEKPWSHMLLRREGMLTLLFSEDPEPEDLESLDIYPTARAREGVLYISYGVSQPSGVIVSRWISLRINPFDDLLAIIDTITTPPTINLNISGYRLSLQTAF